MLIERVRSKSTEVYTVLSKLDMEECGIGDVPIFHVDEITRIGKSNELFLLLTKRKFPIVLAYWLLPPILRGVALSLPGVRLRQLPVPPVSKRRSKLSEFEFGLSFDISSPT